MSLSPAPVRRSSSPLIVDRYAIHEAFAEGGMATVHFARLLGAQGFRRSVAVKRLLPHLVRDQTFARMLLDEARLAARVRHPNVVTTLDVVQTDTELLLVMEYVHGESLATLSREVAARGDTIPLGIATAMVIDALNGLHAVHEARDEAGKPLGIVHRDVSPQNMLACTDGVTRIADFGIAKALGNRQSTQRGLLKGKLAYMAPEQPNQGSLSRATDVYAASVVLWELLAGQRLFEGRTHAEVLFKVLHAPVPRPSTRNGAVPQALDEVVMRGLSRAPEERWASAQEMAAALEAHAPSVRPHEIAAWVARVGGEPLAKRARVLAAMEAGESGEVLAPLASGVRTRTPLPTPPASVEHPAAPAVEASRASGAPRRRGPTRWQVVGCMTAVALLGWGAAALHGPAEPSAPRSEARALPPPLPSPAVRVEQAPPAPRAVLPAPVVTAVEAPTAIASERESDGVDAQLPAPAGDVNLPAARDDDAPARARSSSRARRAARRRGTSGERCDPPYTVDAAGRVLFKVECI